MLEPEAVRSIFSFGKWIFLSTLISFLAMQVDRLTFAAMYPLAEVGVYSIASSLALVVSTLVGRLQGAVVFPWYSRMLDDGVELPEAFHKAKTPVLAMTSYLVALLVVGAASFFKLAYDDRYSQAALYLPILALGVWFSSLGGMYGAAFLAKGHSKWIALVSAVKVVSFLVLLTPLFKIESSLAMATMVVLASEIITAGVGRYLGWRLHLRKVKVELGMLAMLLFSSAVGLYVVRGLEPIARLHPLWQLVVVGSLVTLLFLPVFFKLVYPMLRQRIA
jgi:O-antigen/teichoic acid export membrane protein